MNDIHFYDPRHGEYCIFSNLHPRPVVFNGEEYATPEHAYQAAKARHPVMRRWLMQAPTPEMAAICGDALTEQETVPGWAEHHISLMTALVQAKFDQSPDFKDLLLSTGERRLVEWSPVDNEIARFWGEYQGEGDNRLGHILMSLRAAYRR
ncbi:hypothetical protein BIY29_01855 [Brenneria alni]|uniref:N-glycosidase YbiA n=1 Tax=Brenneria alni TaxID=71656 RepID=A0A421DTH1_9GAMM|nr:NADAR family protein [Brenneria alni]RLM27845.1 hypothetical protein BIY29_01855 [Brenneria alni]